MWILLLSSLPALATAPDAPVLVSPADAAAGTGLAPPLTVQVSDPDGDPLSVTYSLRRYVAPGEDFTIIAMPDTQHYACGCGGGSTETFGAQTAWIAEQQPLLNVAYVSQLGDCTEHGDTYEDEWWVADEAFAAFDEDRSTWPLPEGGLAYGVAAGNHDQTPIGSADGTTIYYNQYFGVDRFSTKYWYGGYYGTNYDNHYDLFDAGGTSFVVIYFEYDTSPNADVLAWADDVLTTYSDRHAIIVSHFLLDSAGEHSTLGEQAYATLAHHEALFLFLSGHIHDEANRTDRTGPRNVHSLLSDYQSRDNGGDGWLRIMLFSPASGSFEVQTYSPTLDTYEDDVDSAMTLDWDPNPAPWSALGTVFLGAGEASLEPETLEVNTTYEWTVTVSDGVESVTGGPWTFTTGDGTVVDSAEESQPPLDSDSPVVVDSEPVDEPIEGDPADTGGLIDDPKGGGGCGTGGFAALGLVLLGARRRRR